MYVDWSKVGMVAKRVGKCALSYGSMILLSRILKMGETSDCEFKIVEYDDAISAIMHSPMLSSDKATMVSMIPRDEKATLYKSIIAVINSTMLTSDKIKTVRSLIES